MSSPVPTSWVEIDPTSDFTLQNIPFGVFSNPPTDPTRRCCTAIGSHVVDLSILASAGLFTSIANFNAARVFAHPTLNEFMSHSKPIWAAVRNRLIELFTSTNDELQNDEALRKAALIPLDAVTMHLGVEVGDYTDFYSSRYHATNVGVMFRGKDNALQPNWLHLPVGYHGRSSSVYTSGTDVRRPCGQLQKDPADPKQGSTYGPCKLLDFELEMGFFVGGPPLDPGTPITMSEADDRIFGYVLMNDWSARDVQKWEYVPLGPFGSKNFATTVSPWIVTSMALEPYRCAPTDEAQEDPQPLEYLRDPNYGSGSYDINLFVKIQGSGMDKGEVVTASNFRNLYWNSRQQLVHYAVTGCNMQPGDLLGTGTISGADDTSLGCMLELCWKGTREVKLGESGEKRKFLLDGDTVIMEGHCEKEGVGRIGFGSCVGKVLPAASDEVVDVEGKSVVKEVDVDVEAAAAPAKGDVRFTNLKLYSYWLSSASWRVRIALSAKGLAYEYAPVHLLKGEQMHPLYTERNPMNQVPVLECLDTRTNQTVRVTQSLAIIDFLEEAFPHTGGSLYPSPSDPIARARAREMAEVVNSGTQPLQNVMLIWKLEEESKGTIQGKAFAREVVEKGLRALEKLVSDLPESASGPFASGSFAPTIADACIVPQLLNARRFEVDVKSICPRLLEIELRCTEHPWFIPAHPFEQPDAVPEVVKQLTGQK